MEVWVRVQLGLTLLLTGWLEDVTTSLHHWDYIIIGAGPAGLQMAYYLNQANRNYVILEKTNTSGSFFSKYPRHGRLISINKRNTGRNNKEFGLRHDWNSLLSDDESLLFKHYSRDFFPQRDALYSYLNDFKSKHNLNVRYNIEVAKIEKRVNDSSEQSFVIRDRDGRFFSCRTLIIATGMWKPMIPPYKGIEYLEGYESAPVDPEYYEGKTVLILGHGNSAFETAESIYGHANLVHVAGRSRVRLAWETHYVGDLRSVNNGLLDTYQLKSLDGIVEGNFGGVYFEPEADRFRLRLRHSEDTDNFALRDSYDMIIRCMGFDFDRSIFGKSATPRRGEGKRSKYPVIGHDYQVAGVNGMYVVGTAAHSLDYRQSAGGFIHGFRYTVRTLHRLLEWKNHEVAWPSYSESVLTLLPTLIKRMNEASAIYQMFGYLGDIIILNNDSTRFTYLEEFPVHKLDELQTLTGHKATKVIVMLMQYGKGFSGPGKDVFRESRATGFAHEAHKSNFLHPVFYYYNRLPTKAEMLGKRLPGLHLPIPNRLHHIVEDFLTDWTGPITHVLPLRRFLEVVTAQDLRNFFAPTCLEVALTHRHLPLYCQPNIPLLFPPAELVQKLRSIHKDRTCSE